MADETPLSLLSRENAYPVKTIEVTQALHEKNARKKAGDTGEKLRCENSDVYFRELLHALRIGERIEGR